MRGEDSIKTEGTAGQRALSRMLTDMGFQNDMEVTFEPYRVDIYLRASHVAIEFDGPSHNRKRDAIRDKFLMTRFKLPVLRVKEFVPEKEVKLKMLAFIREWNSTADERKKILWA